MRLVAVEDCGSLSSALGTLSGLGATIIVAGVESTGAKEALAFAESHEVPTLLMNDPLVFGQMKFGSFWKFRDRGTTGDGGGEPEPQEVGFCCVGKYECEIEAVRPGVSQLPLSDCAKRRWMLLECSVMLDARAAFGVR